MRLRQALKRNKITTCVVLRTKIGAKREDGQDRKKKWGKDVTVYAYREFQNFRWQMLYGTNIE